MSSQAEGVFPIFNCENPDRPGDIVFIHGLGGSSHDTWRHGKEGRNGHFFWPLELGHDLEAFGIWVVGYPAGISALGAPGMIIEKRAGNLALQLANEGIGQRPVVFICHSMGGLVIKALVADSATNADDDRKHLVSNIRGIVFCATPHRGSHFADAASIFAVMAGGSQAHVDAMRANSEPLDLMHDRFVEWHRRSETPIESYAENIGLFKRRALGRTLALGLVVPRASANGGFAGSNVRDIDADHLTIVKPASRRDPVYAGSLRFLRKCLVPAPRPSELPPVVVAEPPRPPESAPSTVDQRAAVSDRTVDRTEPPDFADLMSRGNLVRDIDKAAREGPLVTVGGLSGAGKTYAASEYVRDRRRAGQVVLWHEASPNELVDDLLAEIGPSVGLKASSTSARMQELCAVLKSSNVLVVIDDFQSVNIESYRPLINLILRLPAPAKLLVVTQRDMIVAANARRVAAERFSGAEVKRYIEHRRVASMSDLMITSLATNTSGLPFAISLFCTLVNEYGESALELLSRGLRNEDLMSEWFRKIVERISPPSLKLLRMLSLVGGPYNIGVVNLLARLGDIDEPERRLTELQRAYFLQRYTPFRFSTHDLVSQQCADDLAAPERDRVFIALSNHFGRGFPRRNPSFILPADEFQWKARALEQVVRTANSADEALRQFMLLVSTAKATGRYAFITTLGSEIRAALPIRHAWLEYHVAHAHLICGATAQCGAMMEELLRAEPIGDATLDLGCRRLLAETLAAQGKSSKARALLASALTDAEIAGASATAKAHAKSQLAMIDLSLGQLDEAETTGQMLLAHAGKTKSERGGAIALSILGAVDFRRGHCESARASFLRAVQMFRDSQDKRGFVWASAQLAECLIALFDEAGAVAPLLDAVHTAADIGEYSPDLQAILRRIDNSATDPRLRSAIEFEHNRAQEWEAAREAGEAFSDFGGR